MVKFFLHKESKLASSIVRTIPRISIRSGLVLTGSRWRLGGMLNYVPDCFHPIFHYFSPHNFQYAYWIHSCIVLPGRPSDLRQFPHR